MEISILVILLVLMGVVGFLLGNLFSKRGLMTAEEVQSNYVPKAVLSNLETQSDVLKEEAKEKEVELRQLDKELTRLRTEAIHWQQQIQTALVEKSEWDQKAHTQFQLLAAQLLEEKSTKFTEHNQQQMQQLLQPLREHIKDFGEQIDKRFHQESRDRISLQKEIEQLRHLNVQLSSDAHNLTLALKGDQKMQGDWGEILLERLLEKSGLVKDIHYSMQNSFKDEEGQQKRPDFIVHLPEDKHLIIDSKVSLVHYDRWSQAEDGQKAPLLKQHVQSIKQHIKDLSSKNYQQLYQIQTPDYLLLFVPIEPALIVALQSEQSLFMDALDKHIVLVSHSTLLATMKTVSYIWKQEKQKRNVQEIARQSGQLYDKLAAFVEDLQQVGQRLKMAQNAYDEAMYKLTDGKRQSDTLLGKAEKIKALGAETTKQLPEELLS